MPNKIDKTWAVTIREIHERVVYVDAPDEETAIKNAGSAMNAEEPSYVRDLPADQWDAEESFSDDAGIITFDNDGKYRISFNLANVGSAVEYTSYGQAVTLLQAAVDECCNHTAMGSIHRQRGHPLLFVDHMTGQNWDISDDITEAREGRAPAHDPSYRALVGKVRFK